MENVDPAEVADEYEGRFIWRKSRQIYNLARLKTVAHGGGPDSINLLKKLLPFSAMGKDDNLFALRQSIAYLWAESTECYIFGLFQACIMTCGAVVERCLKYEYELAQGPLPKGQWTLGRCVNQLDWSGIIQPDVREMARQLIDPRNSRAHALLEHSNPHSAYMGSLRGIERVASERYLIEPYRGEADFVIGLTWSILKSLYGVNQE